MPVKSSIRYINQVLHFCITIDFGLYIILLMKKIISLQECKGNLKRVELLSDRRYNESVEFFFLQ